MLIYILLPIAALASGIPICRNKAGRIVYCAVWGVILFVVASVRLSVGYDYNAYGNMYNRFMTLSVDEVSHLRYEKGFAIPIKFLSDYFVDYQTIFYVTSSLFAAAVMLCIYKYCEKPHLGVFCFLVFGIYFVSMDFLRQTAAALVILYAFRFIEKKSFPGFLIFTLFASCFHISALIMIPFYFILRIKMNWITLGVYSLITVLIMVFSLPLMDFVTNYVYKSYDPSVSKEMTVGITPVYTIFFAIFFISAFLLRNDLCKKNAFNNVLLNCMFFNVFFELMGTKHAIISRFAVLFCIPAVVMLMPRVYEAACSRIGQKFAADRKRGLAAKAGVITAALAVCVGMYGFMLADNYNGVVPYRTIFDSTR